MEIVGVDLTSFADPPMQNPAGAVTTAPAA